MNWTALKQDRIHAPKGPWLRPSCSPTTGVGQVIVELSSQFTEIQRGNIHDVKFGRNLQFVTAAKYLRTN